MSGIEIKAILDALNNANGTKRKDVKKEVEEVLSDETISKKELNKALKANSALFQAKAIENKAEEVLESDVQFNEELASKLSQAGFLTANGQIDKKAIQNALLKSTGADNRFDYSHKNSESSAAALDLSINGVEFKAKEVRKLSKMLLGKESVEAAYTPLKTLWRGFSGGAAGAGAGAMIGVNATSTVTSLVNTTLPSGVVESVATTAGSTTFVGTSALLGGIGATVAIGVDLAAQLLRNEKSILGKNSMDAVLNADVTTAEDFNHKIDIACKKNEAGAILMKEIGKLYTDENGNINSEAMKKDLTNAGGRGSALNHKEAYIFYAHKMQKPIEAPKALEMPELKAIKPEFSIVAPIKPVLSKIEIATPEPPKVEAPKVEAPKETTVTVLVGETLQSLAEKYQVSMEDIMKLNPSKIKEYRTPSGAKIKGLAVGAQIKLINADMSKAQNVTPSKAQAQYTAYVAKCVEWGIPVAKNQADPKVMEEMNKTIVVKKRIPPMTSKDAVDYARTK